MQKKNKKKKKLFLFLEKKRDGENGGCDAKG